ncbi:MAG: Biotin carboxylase [Chlamydiae bacterium]|nr:Biotin carboxylase [Chlamydiota bacterium]
MKKVLIANRGEIALRIIRACHELGLETVAIFSEADRESLHVLCADEAVCIGKAKATDSYLKISTILSAAEITNADAIHPGYGFLSEKPEFASLCESAHVKFIGPNSKTISLLGDKAQAKKTAKKAKCPIIPGSDGVVKELEEGIKIAKKIGYPIFIKAVFGGGGKGIRIAQNEEEFVKLFIAAQAEAQVNFGHPDIYLEKQIENPRHIEVQVLGDEHGNVVHLFERDCTLQRRRQKLIEEAPSPAISSSLREKMGQAAVGVAKYANYHSAGTVEFLLDEDNNFYFMEMNTRIQVEHTVTEEITGIDIIKAQLQIAQGQKLPFKQKDIHINGHAIQFRINAEDPANNFMPRPGILDYYMAPGGPHVRVDSNCYAGYKIPPYYDSMIAKLIVRGKNRDEAIEVGKRALKEFHIGGVPTTIPFHLFMLEEEKFLTSDNNIFTIDKMLEEGVEFALVSQD